MNDDNNDNIVHCIAKVTAEEKAQTNLTKIHNNALMNLLPQVSSEDLNEGDLQRWDFAVHEDSGQIELHLETNVHLQHKTECFTTWPNRLTLFLLSKVLKRSLGKSACTEC